MNDLTKDLQKGWCLLLLEEFRKLQETHSALKSLALPNIIIDPKLSRTLGYWDEDRRQIRLAESLIAGSRFETVLFVFKHELAHMLVSELFEIENAMAHGEAFKRACRILDIPACSCIELESSQFKLSETIARIKKLMALGDSTNQHEAEGALTKARELSLKYNIDRFKDNGLEDYDFELAGRLFKRVPSYIWSVCSIVSKYYFCHYICRQYIDTDKQKYQMIELYGQRDNLDLALYIYHFLIQQGELEWQRYKSEQKLRNNREKLSFLNGLYDGFEQKLKRQTKELETEKSLIWLGDPKLDAFYKQRNPRVRTRMVQSQLKENAHKAGQKAGEKLSVNPGLKKSGNSKPSLLN